MIRPFLSHDVRFVYACIHHETLNNVPTLYPHTYKGTAEVHCAYIYILYTNTIWSRPIGTYTRVKTSLLKCAYSRENALSVFCEFLSEPFETKGSIVESLPTLCGLPPRASSSAELRCLFDSHAA